MVGSLCLILFRGTLVRLPGFVRFMLSAKTEPESYPGLIRVLNGAYSLLCSKSDIPQTRYRALSALGKWWCAFLALCSCAFDPSLSWLIKQLGKAACYPLIYTWPLHSSSDKLSYLRNKTSVFFSILVYFSSFFAPVNVLVCKAYFQYVGNLVRKGTLKPRV